MISSYEYSTPPRHPEDREPTGRNRHADRIAVRCCQPLRACGDTGCRPGAGTHHPLGPSQQHRPPDQLWREKVRRGAGGQERRQAEDPRVSGFATRQRAAAAIGGARRHPGNPLGVDDIARRASSRISACSTSPSPSARSSRRRRWPRARSARRCSRCCRRRN